MAELGFQDHNGQLTMRTGFRGARDASPDSVIFSADSNFSLFSSSASCSVERCSFASDVHEHDSLSSEISQHLALHECLENSSSGPDLDPNKSKKSLLCRKVEKAKVQKEHSEVETEDENQVLDSARSSFSQALKDCQVRRLRSEAKKLDRRRPASLDLNNTVTNVTSSSPRYGVMKKTSVSTRQTDTFPSPGTPNYRQKNVGIQKGWSSERVPLHTSANRRNVNNALLPFNNGRTLPSKWEDAERWIFSPVSGDGAVRSSFPQPQRRPKSKSGPLGPPGSAYYSMYSPHMFDGGNVGNLISASPFTNGVIAADSFSIRRDGRRLGGNGNFPARMEPCMGRSVSIHGCTEMLCPSILPSSHDEKLDGVEDEANNVSRAVSRRDMATQMSPEGSPHSSPRGRPFFSPSSPFALPIVEFQSFHSSKQEVRDVQIDERVTMTRWSKKHRARNPEKGSGNVETGKVKLWRSDPQIGKFRRQQREFQSMVQREKARITVWENQQKAKAEAAVRKLEMKLEKKRSSSMDKIMNKLRSAQRKAQQMRSSVVVNQAPQVVGTSQKVIPFRRTCQIVSLSGCFTCHFRTSSSFQCSMQVR